MSFPGAIASFLGFTSSHTLAADSHAAQHNSEQTEIVATQTKIGTGSSTPTSGLLLRGTGAGTSSWAQANLTSDVTGVLSQANGGTGTTLATGTGKAVYDTSPTISGAQLTSSPSITTPTITTPTIADFTNANHNHQNTAGGGTLNATNALQNATVTADKLATGAANVTVATSETTASTSYTALATAQALTVTIGANGIALVIVSSGGMGNTTSNGENFASFAMSGANTLAASDVNAWSDENFATADRKRASAVTLLTGLSPGSTTFTAQFRVNAGTGTFVNRQLGVVPL